MERDGGTGKVNFGASALAHFTTSEMPDSDSLKGL